MEEKILGLKRLFFEKKYNKLIFEIQTTIEKKTSKYSNTKFTRRLYNVKNRWQIKRRPHLGY